MSDPYNNQMHQIGNLLLMPTPENPEICKTLERRSRSTDFLIPTFPESSVQTVYVNALVKLRQQRGLPAHTENEQGMIAEAFRAGMTDIPLEFVDEVFRRASVNYTNIKDPFGLTQLRAAWDEIKNEMRSEVVKAETEILVAEMKVMNECEHEYDFHLRAEDDPPLIKGYHICRNCDRAVPVMEKTSKTAKQIAYLQAAAVKVNVA